MLRVFFQKYLIELGLSLPCSWKVFPLRVEAMSQSLDTLWCMIEVAYPVESCEHFLQELQPFKNKNVFLVIGEALHHLLIQRKIMG